MNKKYYLLTAVLGLAITTVITSTLVSAHDRNWGGNLTEEQKAEWQAKHEEKQQKHEELKAVMDEIIANNDFDAWQQAMEDLGIAEADITPENFEKFKQMHSLMEEGRQSLKQAHDLATEIGLPKLMGHMPKHPRGPWSGGSSSDQ